MNTLQLGVDSWWLAKIGAALILYLHIAGGTVGMISGVAALALRKGGRRHALAGKFFFVSMIAMTMVGGLVSPFLATRHGDPKLFDSIAGFFTFYLVVTSWLTVKRKAGTIGRAEIAALAYAVCLAVAAILIGIRAASAPGGVYGGYGATGYYAWGCIVALAAALDAKVIHNRGITGTARVARHLWRMCTALFVALLSFFAGQQRMMPEFMQGSSLLNIPPFAVFFVMVFWLLKLRFAKAISQLKRRLQLRPSQGTVGASAI